MLWYEEFDKAAKERWPEIEVRCEEPMSAHTTFRIGGGARRMAFPSSLEEMTALLSLAEEKGWPFFVVGNGSNLLICDEGLEKLVIMTAKLCDITVDAEHGVIDVCAGAKLSKVAVAAQENGLGGLAFAHGIPGSLGGAVFMNAGAYGGSMDQIVKRTFYLNERGEVCILEGEKHDFGYRKSYFMQHPEYLILGTELQLKKGKTEEILALIEDLQQRRRDKQPLEYPSGGSTFKRPEGYFAGKLIEDAGLKGCSVGGAQVSEKHAGFVINYNHATGDDVRALIAHVQAVVKEKFGVTLECEIRFLGE